MNQFRDLISRRDTIDVQNVEMLRGIAEAHISDALIDPNSELDKSVRARFQRLRRILVEAKTKHNDHKITVLRDGVIPYLASLDEEVK